MNRWTDWKNNAWMGGWVDGWLGKSVDRTVDGDRVDGEGNVGWVSSMARGWRGR